MKRTVRCVALMAGAVLAAACGTDEPTGIGSDLTACAFGDAAQLTTGEAVLSTGGTLCIEAVDSGTYLLMPFATAAELRVSIFGGGFVDPGPLAGVAARTAAIPLDGPAAQLRAATDRMHEALRAAEARELGSRLGTAGVRATPMPAPAVVTADGGSQGAAPVAPGDLMALNTSTTCDAVDVHTGRVMYVGTHAIVVADTMNPQPGFEPGDWQVFGTGFDELAHPVLTSVFGADTDIDANGRTIIFFTRAVNEIVPPGTAGLVGGYFWRGDLFPRAGLPGRTLPCAASNEAEIIYIAVPDPEGVVRGVPISASTLREVGSATIGHEFQHLISSGRRLYVTHADTFEETWLNEAMSYIAEELLFYAAADLGPRRNLDTRALLANARVNDAFTRYGVGNLGRLNVYLQAPHTTSPFGPDALSTRGAAWAFLRYAADRDERSDTTFFRALADGTSSGLDNLRAALGAEPLDWMRDWSASVYVDDHVGGLQPYHEQPSWNFRNVIAALRIDQHFPLQVLELPAGDGFAIDLAAGGAAYPLFTLTPGTRAALFVRAADGVDVDGTLVRVH